MPPGAIRPTSSRRAANPSPLNASCSMPVCPRKSGRGCSRNQIDMDGVELARQIAARLHTEAVARGADPWQAYAFAVAEAERRGLDVESTSRGAALLDGGRAVFI